MTSPDVFGYRKPHQFLRDVLAYKQAKNPNFSARAWARNMGFKGHSLLGFFLTGARKIKPRHLENIFRGLELSEKEKEYFQALVHYEAAESISEKEIYEPWLKQTSRDQEFSCLELEKFRMISDWVHWAIAEMTQLEDFRSDPVWISRRLGNRVSIYQIETAIERLLNLGLLKKNPEGHLEKTYSRMTTPKNGVSRAIREHHKAILKLASDALEQQDVTEREYNSCVMTIDTKMLSKAREEILAFRARMEKLMEKAGGDQTYELSVQFFRLTEKKKGSRQ